MTSAAASSLLDSCLSGVPFPLTCHLELPPQRWDKAEKLRGELAPLLPRFWEVQPSAAGDSFFFHHGAEFLRWCRELGPTTTLALPVQRLTEDRLRAAIRGGLHRLVVTEARDGNEEALAQAVGTLARLRDEEGGNLPRLRLETGGEAADLLIDRARALGISEIAVGCARPGPVAGPPCAVGSPEGRWRSYLKSRLTREYRFDNFFSFASLREEGGERKDCRFPWDAVRITKDGEVRPCPVSRQTMGRLADLPFAGIWDGEPYRGFRRALLSAAPPEECRSCRLRPWFRPFAPAAWVRAGVNDRFGVQLGTGWHEREEGRAYRWSRKEGVFLLRNAGGKKLRMVLHLPSRKLAQEGEVFIDGKGAGEFRLRRPGDRLLSFPLPEGAGEEVVVKIAVSREIVPREALGNDDLRRIGVAWKGAFLEG